MSDDAERRDDADRCYVCKKRFRMDDAIGTFDRRTVHSRCLPKTPRFTDEELKDDGEGVHDRK